MCVSHNPYVVHFYFYFSLSLSSVFRSFALIFMTLKKKKNYLTNFVLSFYQYCYCCCPLPLLYFQSFKRLNIGLLFSCISASFSKILIFLLYFYFYYQTLSTSIKNNNKKMETNKQIIKIQ